MNAARLRQHLDRLLSWTTDSTTAFRAVLRWKGAILARRIALSTANDGPELAEAKKQLRTISGRLAATSTSVPRDVKQRTKWLATVDELRAKKEQVERELLQKSSSYRLASDVDPASLRAALPKDTALVDFNLYWGPKHRRIAAFVVRPGAVTIRVDLGRADKVDEAVATWRRWVKQGPTGRQQGLETAGDSSAKEIRRRIWEPLAPHLKGVGLLLVSPDGPLCRFPLSALPGMRAGSYLIEDIAVATVPVPRLVPFLLSQKKSVADSEKGLLAVGGVTYGGPARESTTVASRTTSTADTPSRAAFETFAALEHTGAEAQRIVSMADGAGIHGMSLMGADATEEAVRRLAPQSRFLHFATHGYFAPPQLLSLLQPRRTGVDSATGLMTQETDIVGHSPGLLSGLAFAGANRSTTDLFVDGRHDGLITAEEVAALDLSRCELAVLSACETGLGSSAGGEGLMGLQRSFLAAGARSVVASLWSVPDLATRSLMENVYRNLWERKMGRLAALRHAQLTMLAYYEPDQGALTRGPGGKRPVDAKALRAARERRKGKRLHPFFWAGWTLSGDWR